MKSIQEIKEELKRAPEEELPALCALYQEDGRKGVQSLLQQAKKRLERLEREKQRIEAMRAYEEQYGHLERFGEGGSCRSGICFACQN